MMRGIEMKAVKEIGIRHYLPSLSSLPLSAVFHKGGEVLVLMVFHRYTLIATSLAPVDNR
jgi:hypothetical protein